MTLAHARRGLTRGYIICTSAMHNIIASERSGVECARGEIYSALRNYYYAYLELRRTLRWYAAPVEIEIYIYIEKSGP